MSLAAELGIRIRTWDGDVVPWIKAVLARRVVLGELARLAVERHVRDLKKRAGRGLWFDVAAADRRLKFCAFLVHVEDRQAGQPFVPEPWQCFVLGSVHGWRRKDSRRRFTLSYVEVGKKAGKTFMIAGEGLFGVGFDGVQGAKVFSIATKEDQAKLSWEPATAMLRFSADLRECFTANRKRIIDKTTGSYWAPLGSDSNTEDGKNPSLLLVDELHRHPDGALYNTVRFSMAARAEPLTWIITTAGAGRESFCWSVHKASENILRGITQDDSTFVFIACPDRGDDWRTEIAWRKANPNVGVSVRLEFLQQECAKAQANPRLENDFRRFFCNEWTEQVTRWIPMAEWDACSSVPPGDWEAAAEWRRQAIAALAGRPCLTGLDLGRTSDLTAAVHVFPPDPGRDFCAGKWVLLPWFWLPSAKLDVDSGDADQVPYRVWESLGFVGIFEGNAVTSDELEPALVNCIAPFAMQEADYDPAAGARDVAIKLGDRGLPVVEISQGWANISPSAKKFETLVLTHQLEHGGNPVLRWNAANVAVKVDANENLRPTKEKSFGRIDGISATLNALGRAGVLEAAPSTYETNEVLVL